MTDQPCALEHARPGRHKTDCPCATTHDDQHAKHCTGCLPRAADVGLWCQWHYDRTWDALIDIPTHAAIIEASPDGKVARRSINGDATRRSTKVNQASPSEAWDTAEYAIQWAFGWAEAVADRFRHAGPFTYTRAGIPARDITSTTGYLKAHLDAIAACEDFAAYFAVEAQTQRVELERRAGHDQVIHRLKDRCPSCDHKSLTREDGAGQVECQNSDCRRIWLEHEYQTLAHVAAAS